MSTRIPRNTKQRWRVSLQLSLLAHALLLISVGLQGAPVLSVKIQSAPVPLEMADPIVAESAVNVFAPQSDREDQTLAPNKNDSELQTAVQEANETLASANKLSNQAQKLVSDRIAKAIENSKGKSEEQNLAELNKLSSSLEKASSEKSVSEMSAVLSTVLGSKSRATQASEQRADLQTFDRKTAQVTDVKKTTNDQNETAYSVVMVDAEGRTIEIEIDKANGESLHRTMKLIKANPLLEQLYRSVIMSLLDKLLDAE